MKKIAAVICFLAITSVSYSQDTTYKKNFIKANFVGLIFGALNKKNSIQANIAFGKVQNNGFDYQLNAYTIAYRYYFTGNVNQGWLIHAEGGVSTVSADDRIKKESTNSYIWRLYSSYKWTFNKGLTLEAGAGADGLGTKFTDTRYNGFYVPLYPYLNLTVGYAFN
jgi:hypothetical protein